jgi:AcrR family transcriptional regulator
LSERVDGRRQRKKRAVRDSIVCAAARLFVERGFAETRMDAISEAADIAVGTVYNYFKTKTELLVAILLDDVEAFVHDTRVLVARPGGDPAAAIAAVGNALIATMDQRPRSLWRQLLGQALIDATQVGPAYANVERLLLDLVRTLLLRQRAGGVPDARVGVDEAAEIAFALAHRLVYAYCRDDAMTPDDFNAAFLRQLRSVFGDAVASASPSEAGADVVSRRRQLDRG